MGPQFGSKDSVGASWGGVRPHLAPPRSRMGWGNRKRPRGAGTEPSVDRADDKPLHVARPGDRLLGSAAAGRAAAAAAGRGEAAEWSGSYGVAVLA